MTAETVLGFANIASSFEPMAGAALAINLAYLGLTRFRYRDQIRQAAEQQRKIFEPSDKQAPDNIRDMKLYKQICELCALSNFDVDDIPHADKSARINGGFWSNIYHHLYRTHRDRYLCYGCVGMSGFTLAAGVALDVGLWHYVAYLYHPVTANFWQYFLISACLIPISLVAMGRKIVIRAAEHAKECREEIEKAMKTTAATATVPAVENVIPIDSQSAAASPA